MLRLLHPPVTDIAAFLIKGNAQQQNRFATVAEGQVILLGADLVNGDFGRRK